MALDRVGRSVMACCSVTYLTNSNRTPAKATEIGDYDKGQRRVDREQGSRHDGAGHGRQTAMWAEVVVMRRGRPSGGSQREEELTVTRGSQSRVPYRTPRPMRRSARQRVVSDRTVDHHQHRRGCFAQKREHGDPGDGRNGRPMLRQTRRGGRWAETRPKPMNPRSSSRPVMSEYQLSGSNSYGHAATRGEEPAEEQQLHRRIRDQLAQ